MRVSQCFCVLMLNLLLLLVFKVWLPQGQRFQRCPLSPREQKWEEAGGSSIFFKSVHLATVMDPEVTHVLPGVFPGVIYCAKILAHSLGGFSSFNVPTEP